MKKYQYQIIRYMHDHFTGEYVNVGIVLYAKEERFLKCKTTTRYKRIVSMFPQADGRWIIRLLNNFKQQINQKSHQLSEIFQPGDSLEQVTHSILNRDNNAIHLSEVRWGLDINPDAALEDLYDSQVEKYFAESSDRGTLLDADVWRTRYKQYFEKYGIDKKLSLHEVSVPRDVISFEKSWKNEIWHSYEPLSFVLQGKESVKDKVYKWAGKLQGLLQSEEALHLTLMTSISPDHMDLRPFIFEYLQVNSEKLMVDIVSDDQAEELALRIKTKMERHDNP